MASRIVQRLVAAGASPERAAAFEAQFAKARPGLAPKKLEDAFDEELGAISASIWPNTFRPQDLDDAQTIEYFKGIYGPEKYNQIVAKAAPMYSSALGSANQYIKDIASAAQQGIPLADVTASIRNDALTDSSVFGGLTEEDIISQAGKIYTDYNKASGAAKSFLSKDKYYKANLPNPKIKYGRTTDLAAGVIDYRTHPSVEKYIAQKPQEKLAISPSGAGISPIAARAAQVPTGAAGVEAIQKPGKEFEDRLFTKFIESGATPFFDEVKRRESVKGKTIK